MFCKETVFGAELHALLLTTDCGFCCYVICLYIYFVIQRSNRLLHVDCRQLTVRVIMTVAVKIVKLNLFHWLLSYGISGIYTVSRKKEAVSFQYIFGIFKDTSIWDIWQSDFTDYGKKWKSIKKCKTYSRKATGLFFSGHGVEVIYHTCISCL